MARLLTIDHCSVSLRNALLSALRSTDEAVLLPSSEQSVESGAFKNIAFRLDGVTPNLPQSLFSSSLFSGISAIRLSSDDSIKVKALLSTPDKRRVFLQKLNNLIPSETSDSSLEVGASLECDEAGCDTEGDRWTAGFDGKSGFCGIFSSNQSTQPNNGFVGMNRCHEAHYLVCRAGAGIAATTFQPPNSLSVI